MKNKITRILALWSIIFITNNLHAEEGPCFGNGIHNGWANQHSIVIWTRLTKHPEMNVDGKPFLLPSSQEIKQLNKSNDTARQLAVQLPEGATLEDMEGACPGMPGEVRLSYWLDGKSKDAPQYPWQAVDNDKDFTTQWTLTNLQARYQLPGTSGSPQNWQFDDYQPMHGAIPKRPPIRIPPAM